MTEPEVSVPAIMRNYHEVLRNDLSKVLTPLAEQGDMERFAAAWNAYRRAIAVHAAMEDGVEGAGGGSVRMLDHYFNGAAGAAMFRLEHEQEHEAQDAVTRAIGQGLPAMRDAFAAYRDVAAAHLKHEEDILMPLVARLPQPKAPIFAQWCLSAGIAQGDFDHFVVHGVASLSAWGSTSNSPVGATRVFLHSLKTLCTLAQWERYLPLARRAASASVWSGVLAQVPSLEALPATAN